MNVLTIIDEVKYYCLTHYYTQYIKVTKWNFNCQINLFVIIKLIKITRLLLLLEQQLK